MVRPAALRMPSSPARERSFPGRRLPSPRRPVPRTDAAGVDCAPPRSSGPTTRGPRDPDARRHRRQDRTRHRHLRSSRHEGRPPRQWHTPFCLTSDRRLRGTVRHRTAENRRFRSAETPRTGRPAPLGRGPAAATPSAVRLRGGDPGLSHGPHRANPSPVRPSLLRGPPSSPIRHTPPAPTPVRPRPHGPSAAPERTGPAPTRPYPAIGTGPRPEHRPSGPRAPLHRPGDSHGLARTPALAAAPAFPRPWPGHPPSPRHRPGVSHRLTRTPAPARLPACPPARLPACPHSVATDPAIHPHRPDTGTRCQEFRHHVTGITAHV